MRPAWLALYESADLFRTLTPWPVVASSATIHAPVWARDPANADGFLLSGEMEMVVHL